MIGRPLTPREQGDAVKRVLREKGWVQGPHSKKGGDPFKGGGKCLVYAMIDALPCTQEDAPRPFVETVKKLLRVDYGFEIVEWNDAPGRTLEEVYDLIDRAVAAMESA